MHRKASTDSGSSSPTRSISSAIEESSLESVSIGLGVGSDRHLEGHRVATEEVTVKRLAGSQDARPTKNGGAPSESTAARTQDAIDRHGQSTCRSLQVGRAGSGRIHRVTNRTLFVGTRGGRPCRCAPGHPIDIAHRQRPDLRPRPWLRVRKGNRDSALQSHAGGSLGRHLGRRATRLACQSHRVDATKGSCIRR
jgi:hypothetical protein